MTASAKADGALPTSQPAARSTSHRDSGFHDGTQDAASQNKTLGAPASRDGDSGFHDSTSITGQLGSMADSDDEVRQKPASAGRDRALAATGGARAPHNTQANSQATQADEEFHDAVDDHQDNDEPDFGPNTIQVTSERSIVVSSRQDNASEHSIVVSEPTRRDQHMIHVQPTPSKKARREASDKDQTLHKTANRSIRAGNRDVIEDAPQPSIAVSGGDYEGEQSIQVKPQTAVRNKPNAASAPDVEEYTVSHISAHRTGPGSDNIELLVHWEDSPDDNEPTWEQEESLQEGALDAVVDYWATIEGGRAAVRPHEVYAIIGHEWLKKGRAKSKSLHLEVEWLGYKETSMEPVRRFSQDQPELVEDYFESIGGRPKPPPWRRVM